MAQLPDMRALGKEIDNRLSALESRPFDTYVQQEAFNTALAGKLDATATAVAATKATQDGAGNIIEETYATKASLGSYVTKTAADAAYLPIGGKAKAAVSADTVTKAGQDSAGNSIIDTYAKKTEIPSLAGYVTKTSADTYYLGKTEKAESAKTADSATDASNVPWAGVSGKPASYTPATHTHALAEVTGLQSALDQKLATSELETALKELIVEFGGTVPTE